MPQGRLMQPADIAEMYVQIHRQPRTIWTQELDLRPWSDTPWFNTDPAPGAASLLKGGTSKRD